MRIDCKADGVAISQYVRRIPGTLLSNCGYLSMKRLNIVHGRIFTGKTGIVMIKSQSRTGMTSGGRVSSRISPEDLRTLFWQKMFRTGPTDKRWS